MSPTPRPSSAEPGFAFEITPQPSETTCGAAALRSVYRYWGLDLPLTQVIRDVVQLPEGGTLAVHLGRDALRRGFEARIHTCDLQLFDPSWFDRGAPPLAGRLTAQLEAGHLAQRQVESARAYLDFLAAGGEVRMEEMSTGLLTRQLRRGVPLIAGLSSTWLYRARRERWENDRSIPDDLRGAPTGHFLVVHGVDSRRRKVRVADPYLHAPYPGRHDYEVPIRRFFNALMLGAVTHDAKLLVVRPGRIESDD